MSDKKTYRIERIQELIAELGEFNRNELRDIVLTFDGKPIEISDEVYAQWNLCGLSNKSFIEMECWTESGQADLTAPPEDLLPTMKSNNPQSATGR